MPPRRYVTVDVFADRMFGGNPLAVVFDAAGLDGAAMQAIAAEFNYAETTFVLPPADPAHTARVRIFTPRAEVPFAGHPNVGTGFALATAASAEGRALGPNLAFEEQAGLVAVTIRSEAGCVVGAECVAPQALACGREIVPDLVAACCGLRASDIVTARHRPVVASVGLAFVLAEVVSLAALAAARPSLEAFAAHLPTEIAGGIHLYVADGPGRLRARMFAPLLGVTEDPATGSACAALAAYLAERAPAGETQFALAIAQGVEMGRPSLIEANVERSAAGAPGRVRIGGSCVSVMRGELLL